jgi:hypothetical protein
MTRKTLISVGAAAVFAVAAVGHGCADRRPAQSARPKLPPELTIHYPASRPATTRPTKTKVRNARGMIVDAVRWQTPLDADLDGDVDGVDYGIFAACFNGDGNPVAPGCGYTFRDVNTALKYQAGFSPRSFTVRIRLPDGTVPPWLVGASVAMEIPYSQGTATGGATIGDDGNAAGQLVFTQRAQ